MKDLKYQMVRKRTEKLIKRFVGLYKIKEIVLANVVKLDLLPIVKIHLVVNMSRVYICRTSDRTEKEATSSNNS